MSSQELINVYNKLIQPTPFYLYLSLPVLLCISIGFLFIGYKQKQKNSTFNKLLGYFIGILSIGLLFGFFPYLFYILTYQDKDYETVVNDYINPYIQSLEPVVYHQLELIEVINVGVKFTTTSQEIGALLMENDGSPRSKLSKDFDALFKLNELNYVESDKDYSYIEVRQFPFELDHMYNTNYVEKVAYMTLDDMIALFKQNKIDQSRIESSFITKLGIEFLKNKN